MNNDRPTPETDAAKRHAYDHIDQDWVDVEFASRLESERDEAREQNKALRDALRVRISYSHCPECDRYLSPSEAGFHAETCRHYATERKVME